MPTILSEERVEIDFADIVVTESHAGDVAGIILRTRERSSGVHVSGITKHIALSTGVLKPYVKGGGVGSTRTVEVRNGEVDEEGMPLRMALGMAWERWVAGLYVARGMEWQPGEQTVDGISGSIDGYTVEYGIPYVGKGLEEILVVEEFKLTWKSSFHPFLSVKQKLWMWQGMAYAYMWGTRWVRWHVGYVNGDYRMGGFGEPEYRKVLVEFTDKELEGNWRMLVRNRDEKGVVRE